jgi:hypothetical protein
MAKGFVCPACKKGCRRGAQHRCDTSSDACSVLPPSIQDHARIPYDECNRYFRNAACVENHRHLKRSGRTLCEFQRKCRKCVTTEGQDHECNKRYCSHCLKNRELGHKCYTAPLSDRAPHSDKVLFIFCDFETRQNKNCSETSFEHMPNLVCVQQF